MSDPWPDPDSPELALSLAKVLSGAAPEFQATAAKNHMDQADRLLHSDWFSTLLISVRKQALREGWEEGHEKCRCKSLGLQHVNPHTY